jgi:hypothetical protein
MNAAAKGDSGPSEQGDGKGGAAENRDGNSERIVAEPYITHRKLLE